MTPIIRMAALPDSGVLARLHRECFEEAWDEEWFRRLLQNPGTFALLASGAAGTTFECFVLIQIAADQAEILSIGTVPSARRAGLAAAILEAAMAEASRRNAQTVFLEVACDNPAALALYTCSGFEVAGRRRSYYSNSTGPALDALMLRAILQRN